MVRTSEYGIQAQGRKPANLGRWVVPVATLLLSACSAHVDSAARSEHLQQQDHRKPIEDQQTHIAPGRCRIIATVVSIDTVLEESGPCSKAPCRGTIRVDSVVGYGSAFGNPLSLNQRIEVHFTFTLAPTTKNLFPNTALALPGLTVGDKFQADVESRHEMGVGERNLSYNIQDYRKLN